MIWVSIYSGIFDPIMDSFNPYLSPLHWHMHEMFFGFGWALLGGFLLTASKNWLGIRGVHGLTLAGLVALWVLDRDGTGRQLVGNHRVRPFIAVHNRHCPSARS